MVTSTVPAPPCPSIVDTEPYAFVTDTVVPVGATTLKLLTDPVMSLTVKLPAVLLSPTLTNVVCPVTSDTDEAAAEELRNSVAKILVLAPYAL